MKEVKVKDGNVTVFVKNIFAYYKRCAPEGIPMFDYWVEDTSSGYNKIYTVGSDDYLRETITTQKTPLEYYSEWL